MRCKSFTPKNLLYWGLSVGTTYIKTRLDTWLQFPSQPRWAMSRFTYFRLYYYFITNTFLFRHFDPSTLQKIFHKSFHKNSLRLFAASSANWSIHWCWLSWIFGQKKSTFDFHFATKMNDNEKIQNSGCIQIFINSLSAISVNNKMHKAVIWLSYDYSTKYFLIIFV